VNILILGATGFVGSWLTTRLLSTEHHIICGVQDVGAAKSQFPNATILKCNFLTDVHMEDWLETLNGVDVVINCVGIFHASKEVMWNLHYHTPKALFDAANRLEITKIIHLSALGIETYDTQYAQSKLAAENYLASLPIQYFILKPSMIYGPGARGGMELMTSLASLPGFIPLPGRGKQELQPIHIEDYVEAIVYLVETTNTHSLILSAVSPEIITLHNLLKTLRRWLGFGAAQFIKIPLGVIKWVCKLGNLSSGSLINTSALVMLEQHNTTTRKRALEFQEITGVKPLNFKDGLHRVPSSPSDRWHARLYTLFPLLRFSLAFMWIFSALSSAFFSTKMSYDLLAAAHISPAVQSYALYTASFLNFMIGFALIFNYKTKLNCLLQIAVIFTYTTIISLFMPVFWIEPFGPIVKNIPILVAIVMLFIHSQ
jgi:uncharacterized protein YbjT (DUF2867 family)